MQTRLTRTLGRWAAMALAVLVCGVPAGHADPGQAVIERAGDLISQHHFEGARVPPSALETPESLRAYLSGLDPYSGLVTPARMARIRARGRGSKAGLGVVALAEGERFLLVPLQDGPLHRAGIANPQYLEIVDRERPEDIEAARAALGGDTQRLVLTDAVDETRHRIIVVPGDFRPASVETWRARGQAYLRLHDFFRRKTVSDVTSALENMPDRSPEGPLVIDLRYTLGGDLGEAMAVANRLLPEGLALAQTLDNRGEGVVFESTRAPVLPVAPENIYVLVSRHTASSGEILAGALAAAGATLVGERTYGKCLAQDVFPLPEGWGLMLSTKQVLDARGRYCDGKPLEPDFRRPGRVYDSRALIDLVLEQSGGARKKMADATPEPGVETSPATDPAGDPASGPARDDTDAGDAASTPEPDRTDAPDAAAPVDAAAEDGAPREPPMVTHTDPATETVDRAGEAAGADITTDPAPPAIPDRAVTRSGPDRDDDAPGRDAPIVTAPATDAARPAPDGPDGPADIDYRVSEPSGSSTDERGVRVERLDDADQRTYRVCSDRVFESGSQMREQISQCQEEAPGLGAFDLIDGRGCSEKLNGKVHACARVADLGACSAAREVGLTFSVRVVGRGAAGPGVTQISPCS